MRMRTSGASVGRVGEVGRRRRAGSRGARRRAGSTVAVARVISLLTPRVEPGRSSSSASGQRSPSVRTPRAGPAGREQAHERPDRPAQLDGAAHDDDVGRRRRARAARSRPTRARRAGATLARKWSSRPPPAPTTVTRVAPRALRRGERELEVGRVLVGRVLLDHGAVGDRARSSVGAVTESRSPTTRSRVPAERVHVLEPGVGGDDRTRRRASASCQRASSASPPANTSASIAAPVARGHADDGKARKAPCAGMTRIRF